MRQFGLMYLAALSAVLALAPVEALAQSTGASAAGNASGTIVLAQQTYLDVMANLEASGYTIVETKSTFLGRVQITARNDAHIREIVVSRSTGEVKRDLIVEVFANAGGGGNANVAAGAASGTSEPDAPTGLGGLLGALGFKPNANISAGTNASISGGSQTGVSPSSGSVSGGISGGLSGEASGGLSGGAGSEVSGDLSGDISVGP